MGAFEPRDADAERRMRESFARQGLMRIIGATLTRVSAGKGYAAMSLAPAGDERSV
jgi:hypothetical protein